ncbi:MAG: hypothetical protein GF364_17460 [Candidatus Lokiarchaeota archaeon]|nr:hypothetical protein [Candidatus Lokiarchaeota archaeon]
MASVNEILEKLGNPTSEKEFKTFIININAKEVVVSEVIDLSIKFLNYFGKYLNHNEFRKELYDVLKSSYDICEDIGDLTDILLKTTILRLIEIYLSYSSISGNAKESVLNILGSSFGMLDPAAQIINVSLMVDPIFNDPEYKKQKAKREEKVVTYKEIQEISDVEKQYKEEIHQYIKTLTIDLDKQNEQLETLRARSKEIGQSLGLDLSSKQYRELEEQSVEMLTMQMTSIALLGEFDDNDLSPISIN